MVGLSATRQRPDYLDELVDLGMSVRSMVNDTALLAIRSGRQIEFAGPSTIVCVRGSRPAIEAVISNLIDNALRAEPEGGIVVVRCSTDATIEVIDHGLGIEVDDQTKIFEPFWRKTEKTPGAGLGLTIARDLMDKHAGRIWVEETPGGGATFKLSFPKI